MRFWPRKKPPAETVNISRSVFDLLYAMVRLQDLNDRLTDKNHRRLAALQERVALLEQRVDMLDAADDAELITQIEEQLMDDDEWHRTFPPSPGETPA